MKLEVTRDANEVTRIVAELTKAYSPTVPADVALLDYYGREIEIWSSANQLTKLQDTQRGIQEVWARLKPQVIARSNRGKIEANTFDGYVQRINQAKTVDDFKKIASPYLDEVDKLENVFGG